MSVDEGQRSIGAKQLRHASRSIACLKVVCVLLGSGCTTAATTSQTKTTLVEIGRWHWPIAGDHYRADAVVSTRSLSINVSLYHMCQTIRKLQRQTHVDGEIHRGPVIHRALQVLDSCDDGRPVASAEVSLRIGGARVPLGKTAANGQCTLALADLDALTEALPPPTGTPAQLIVHEQVAGELPLSKIRGRTEVVESALSQCHRVLGSTPLTEEGLRSIIGMLEELRIRGIVDARVNTCKRGLFQRYEAMRHDSAVRERELARANALLRGMRREGAKTKGGARQVPSYVERSIERKQLDVRTQEWAIKQLCDATAVGAHAVLDFASRGTLTLAQTVMHAIIGDKIEDFTKDVCRAGLTAALGPLEQPQQ